MVKLLVIASYFLFSSSVFPTKGLDFEDKNLKKEIQKIAGSETAEMKEISIPDAGFVQGKFFTFYNPGNLKKYIYVGRVNSCRAGGCSNPALPATGLETSEYFDYFVVFDANLAVQQVKVYNYQATHGQEVTNKGWLKQFQGYDGSRQLNVGKNIDAISGATVSVQAITTDIQEKTILIRKLVKEEQEEQ
jgi:hypothetical protein